MSAPLMPSAETCVSYACGADPANLAGRYACAYYGMAQALSCQDPQCTPYCPDQQVMAQAAALPASQPAPVAVLTPQSIIQAVPTITLQPAPIQMTCDWWSTVNGNIAQNPLLAAGILGILGFAVLSSRRKARAYGR